MKIEFPIYENGQRIWTNEIQIKEVDELDYCKTIEDLNNFIDYLLVGTEFKTNIKLFEFIEQIKHNINTAIETKKVISFLDEIYQHWKKEEGFYDGILYDYPINIKSYWEEKKNELHKQKKINLSKTNAYIKQNKDIVFEILDNKKIDILNNIKEKKQLYNKNYKNKLIKVGLAKEKVLLTDEERINNRKEANKKYYLKLKCQKMTTDV
jgi:hypothetical protein